ncbi:MAG: hypothetical protein MUE79_07505 [Nitratireductor sp.]|nr:hypothetical protein [Nitratireductor sp.]
MYKLLTASALALFATTAMAQDTVMFDDNQRTIFMDENNVMRPEADVRTRYMALSPEEQAAIRTRCDEWRNVAPQGSSDLTDTSQNQMPNPAPGAIMRNSCNYVQNF